MITRAPFRGVGEYPGQQCYDAARPSWYPGWMSTPSELACVMAEGSAGFYEMAQYGRITRPGDVAGPSPTSPADVANTAAELRDLSAPGGWTFEDSQVDPAEYAARLRAQIAADEKSGAYNPDGNLPLKALDLEILAPFLIAGAVLIGWQFMKGAGRNYVR